MSDHSWLTSFPIHESFKMRFPAAFHVFNKDIVDPPEPNEALFDPPDADYTFNVKVMLMAAPDPDTLIEKTCVLADGSLSSRDSLVHPTRAIQFLVGTRGKNETMAIGGPWSPSLDGDDPVKDPSVLIKTAIRACKALTGIDLTNCTQWHKFLEIHYRRQETSTKPSRTETTVVFLPDIWSVMPSPEEYSELIKKYEEAVKLKLDPNAAAEAEKARSLAEKARLEAEEAEKAKVKEETNPIMKAEEEDSMNESVKQEADNAGDGDEEGDEETIEGAPTPWKDLDVKSMKVAELRSELVARGLNSKGLKSQLVVRLQQDVEKEKEKELVKSENDTDNDNKNEEVKESDPEIVKIGDESNSSVKEECKPDSPAVEEVKDLNEDTNDVMEVDEESKNSSENVKKEEEEEIPKPAPLDERQKREIVANYQAPSEYSHCFKFHCAVFLFLRK